MTQPFLIALNQQRMSESQEQAPLAIVASGGEWVGRSLENVLESNGYTVVRVESGRRALELARRTKPDALLLDDSLPDIGAVDVCRALRDDPLFNHATPVIIMAPAQYASRIRAAAYAAGAWVYCTLPVDVETLLARLATFIRARQEVDTIRSKSLIDGLTGLYTEHGLEQWAEQLGARALRKREALACVVVAPDLPIAQGTAPTPEQASDALSAITDVCRAQARRSDILGYLGQSRVAILAPDTDVAGVQRLIDRLQQSLSEGASKGPTRQRTASLRAGYCAVSNLAASNLSPGELVRRAETALAYAPRGGFDSAAVNFDEMLTS